MRCSNNADSFRTISLPDLNLKGSAQQRQMAVIGTHCGIAQIGQWKLSGVGAGCCGEPMFDNAGSQNSLLEDREACAMELEKSPAAIVYRQNPTAHPEYVSQVFEEMNRCIGRKGWTQVRSQREQELVREAITTVTAPQFVCFRGLEIRAPFRRRAAGARRPIASCGSRAWGSGSTAAPCPRS